MKLHFDDPALKANGLTIKFLRTGKVLFKLEGEDSHVTLHPGHHSGIMDLHRTNELAPKGHPSKHVTLGTLSKVEFFERMWLIGPHLMSELIGLMRPIRLGWMIRHSIGIGPALPPDSALRQVTGIHVGKGTAEIGEPLKGWIEPPMFYEDILQHPGRAYSLFDCKKRPATPYGLLVTYRGPHGYVQMIWIRRRDLFRWVARWEPHILDLFRPLLEAAARNASALPHGP